MVHSCRFVQPGKKDPALGVSIWDFQEKQCQAFHVQRYRSVNYVWYVNYLEIKNISISMLLSGDELPHSTPQLVAIRFDTATFDNIERDKKIKTEAQLSLIGGTMGLLTGFSIISGVELICFVVKLLFTKVLASWPFCSQNS